MPFDRRKFLKSGSIVTAGLIGGCMEGGDGGSGGEGSDGSDGADGGDGSDGGDGDDGSDDTPTETKAEVDYPTESIRFIIPTNPGGGYDFYARLVAKYINEKDYLPESVEPENVAGEATVLGSNELYNAEPDGYTNGIINPDIECKAPFLPQYEDVVKFDPTKFTFYPRVAGSTVSLAVAADSDITSLSGLIEAVRNEEVKIGMKNLTGTATMAYVALAVAGEQYDLSNVLDNVVQYDGTGPIMSGLQRGEIQVTGGSYSSLLQYHKSEDVRIITVFTQDDEPPSPDETPDAETLATTDVDLNDPQGVISMAGGTYHRVFAGPPDIPEERAEIFRTAIRKAIQDPDLQTEAEENDRPINFLNSEDTRKGVVKMYELWKDNQDLLLRLEEGG